MSVSPIHVHVQDNTPLHLHVKKQKRNDMSKQDAKRKNSVRIGSKTKVKTINEPWVPAPGRTSSRDKYNGSYKWDSQKAQLEINNARFNMDNHQDFDEPLKQSDLSTDEDNRLRSHIGDYEKKIESLMNEVGSLKNEAQNFDLQIVDKVCDSCSGDILVAENKHASQRENDEGDFVRSSYRPDCKFKSHCPCTKLIDTILAENNESPVDDKVPSEIYCLQPSNTSLNSSKEFEFDKEFKRSQVEENGFAKVSFKKPLAEYCNWEMTEKDQKMHDTPPVSKAGKLSYEEWGRSYGVLKADSSLELKKVEKELENKEDQLEVSKAALEGKQKELRYIAKEYQETEKENARLRQSVGKYQEDLATSLGKLEVMTSDDDMLHRQLIEVEVVGAEAGKQVAALRDIIQRLKYEKRLSHNDVNTLNKQRELFLEKLEEFESSNRTVRRLLQTEHKKLSDVNRLEEQRDILMKKLADSDSDILRLRSDLIQKSNDLEQVLAQVTEEKNHARTLNELNKSVEATRAHLQRELRSKEMENNRLHVQLKNLDRDAAAIREEAEKLSEAAKSEREAIAVEKEELKRAARSLRNRAEKSEDILKEVEYRLADRERKLEEARSQADAWRDRYQRTSDEKVRLEDHVQSLAGKVTENEAMNRTNEMLTKTKEDELKKQLDRLTAENVRYRSDIERYKTDVSLAEERHRQAQQEATALRTDIRQQENVESDLRNQLRKAKSEAEEALLSVEKMERNSRRMREDGSNEIERVREQMLDRMKDLQPLPELLKETEMKLQDAQDKLNVYEQRSAEQTRLIADLTNKDGAFNDEVSILKQRIAALNDENRALEARLQILHVKLDDRDLRVKESVLDTVNKDEKLQQLQLKLEEISHERDSLKRQLDTAVSDSRRAVDAEVDKATVRDHANQSRIIDLETQITRFKADIAAIKRSKEDAERRSQSKLQDARDRLEQAESTNRSMKNYVNFLKKSYTNVFGTDSSMTSTPIRGGPTEGPNSSFY